MLGDCDYCGDPLTNELQSVTCDHCGEGFHVECAREAGELSVTVESKLLGSDNYRIECPFCDLSWSAGYDPR
ncbi:hypothetical protein [Haloarcula salinisoli]|uniref:RING-type domain-containing protein n=1 Tax=Haloarcula salinisoli TaxID=2487746 RepID=A0A8J7YFR9_9EURY|nr:hypothetical protein [Halomicroarcula salinisoli]MBX0286313.1 hypothetical protein [Halomicroarcula salinisoli]MBX0302199.1 hypothetical protein [Halomicroarcula salinisoli]